MIFHEPKIGSAPREWEDGAGYATDDNEGGSVRCVVLDGATEAYDAVRWVMQLAESFLGIHLTGACPALTPAGMGTWFGQMQDLWLANAPARFTNVYEERKFRKEGSFATLLGCEIRGLAGERPSWTAVALGDTVLFHVRDARLLGQFPALAAGDFGVNPNGVFTQPEVRARMLEQLGFATGELRFGDWLFVATDALAAWIIGRTANHDGGENQVWQVLSQLDHPEMFRQLVDERRNAREMKNDDVTLLRVEVTGTDPDALVVCG